RIALCVLLAGLAGCSAVSSTYKDAKHTVGDWFGSGADNTLTAEASKKPSGNATQLKYAATLRVSKYVDQRKVGNPRWLGVLTSRVKGISGRELIMDQDVATIATAAIKRQFDGEGFQVLEGSAADKALFEVSGVIKEMTLNVKERDDINIVIETTLKEVSTGKVVWSGMVVEKSDRFAGVAGNDKEAVVAYMNWGLRTVNKKTVEAITTALMATRPELFNLTPGSKPIPGVTVFVAPTAASVAPAAAPVVNPYGMPGYGVPANAPVPASSYAPHASATAGLLLVNTDPQRAKVYLDGVYYGLSPLRLEMEPGVHAISVKLEGYKMVTEKVSVRKGDNTELELHLER
ncbi:MAG TPA: PEGA domain-containing protein, partial [Gallionella sp.]|nr:PEGA domain-containing protein [Gallionella sp.]